METCIFRGSVKEAEEMARTIKRAGHYACADKGDLWVLNHRAEFIKREVLGWSNWMN